MPHSCWHTPTIYGVTHPQTVPSFIESGVQHVWRDLSLSASSAALQYFSSTVGPTFNVLSLMLIQVIWFLLYPSVSLSPSSYKTHMKWERAQNTIWDHERCIFTQSSHFQWELATQLFWKRKITPLDLIKRRKTSYLDTWDKYQLPLPIRDPC